MRAEWNLINPPMRGEPMYRASAVLGKPVVFAGRGLRLGTVVDLLIDADRGCVTGFLIQVNVLASSVVLPTGEIEALGLDAVVARAGATTTSPSEWESGGRRITRVTRLQNRRVLTRAGHDIGAVVDVHFDATGRLEAYDISNQGTGDRLPKRWRLAHSTDIAIGTDAVIVSDASLPTADRR